MITNTRLSMVAAVVSAVSTFFAGSVSAAASPHPTVVGRVSFTEVRTEASERHDALKILLEARFAPAPGSYAADQRLIALVAREGEPDRFLATVYDYTVEKGFAILVDGGGNEISRETLADQPRISDRELEEAMAIVSTRSRWAAAIRNGTHRVYAPMPAVSTDKEARRLVNVGVISELKGRVVRPEGSGLNPETGPDAHENEVVSVHIPTGEIVRHASGAPPTSLAQVFACGPPSSGCGASVGSCASNYHLEWPAGNPKWKLDVMHPACTNAVQPDGTGIEILNVYYENRLVLQRAGMPVLNVLYDGNSCGPFRDWLDSENCFQATGVDVGSGFRVTTGNPAPETLCESNVDTGNFLGVAIHDFGDTLLLMTETTAGWYRYVMEWRFGLDGSIEPFFGFGAVDNSCTCNAHAHHAYWRFEVALDGDATTGTGGIATLERIVPGTTDQWTSIAQEGKFVRPAATPDDDIWRIKNQQTGMSYIVKPGVYDGSVDPEGDGTVDPYAKADYWALAYNPNQINDSDVGTTIGIDSWINGEAIGTTKRLVLWYRAGWRHTAAHTDACETVGPRFEFSQPCAGRITLDQASYSCTDLVNVELNDTDLVGAGSQNVAVTSTTETSPETLTLTESPAGSGHFVGSIPTTAGAAVGGDGQVSVADGDSITVRYVDASLCGAPNVNVDKLTTADCAAPVISNVQVANVADTSATLTWATDEDANSRLTYGTTPPPSTNADDLADFHTAHAIDATGLVPCTTYYASVTSADAAGNSATESAGGTWYRFTTKTRAFVVGPDNVESGSGIWTPSGTAGSAWHIDTCKSSSPTHAWKAGSATCPGTYGNSATTDLTSGTLNLGASGHGYHLRFKEWYKTESGFDLLRPQISVNGGTNWTDLASYSGVSGAWIVKDYDLAAYTGSNVRIRFHFTSDTTILDEGWYVDDIDVSRMSACTADLARQSHLATDACTIGGVGNGNAIVEPGENAVLQVTASNLGIAAATNVSATLSTTTPGITIADDTSTFPTIPAGGSATSAPPHYSFTVGTGVPCGSNIDFSLAFEADQGSWSSAFGVSVGQLNSGTATFVSTDVPKPIPDVLPAGVTSNLTVPTSGTVTDVNVTVNITHTYDDDLILTLIGTNAARVTLASRRGGSADNFTNTVFDDQATTPIGSGAPPFTGSYRPDGLLSALDGTASNGLWKLEVADVVAVDTGTINAWSVTLGYSNPPTCNACAVSAPGEPSSLLWTGGSKESLAWTPASGASWYSLHRGVPASLLNLTNASVDSCRAHLGTGPTAGNLTDTPPTGSFLWYLVTGGNAAGEGSAGSGTAGPRILDSSGDCP